MNSIIFIIVVYLNLLIGLYVLFPRKEKRKFTVLYLGMFVVNLFVPKYTLFFLIALYLFQGYFLYRIVVNPYLTVLLLNFLMNVIGLAFFVAYDIPRYFGLYDLGMNSIIELILVTALYWWMRMLDKKYHLFDYFRGYTKKMKRITILSTILFFVLYSFHESIGFYSFDYLLTSAITLLFNLSYTLLFILFIIYQKKINALAPYLKDKKETEEYYAKLDEFRHDYLNYISALEYSLKNKEQEESVRLLHHLKEYSLEMINDARHNPLKRIAEPAIRGLFYDFMERADQQEIAYDIQVLNPILQVNIDYIDMLRLLSIALNNSLEHYSVKKSTVPIAIVLNQTEEAFSFKISNPADMTGTSLADILKRGTSAKKEGGLGLYNFAKLAERYTNVNYEIRYIKKLEVFELELVIAEKKKNES
ncbi:MULTISPECIES: GHKL domain-containing protein [unclassified Enterococcus]|uniref:GHKL domain-containing protein n=1 Tax=unclassified Enterococcus TaxID=2608891 RepID=UPI0013EC23F3|nr:MULTISPECIES: GHKL domain-containing protein [unclassified Enterococcus]